MNSHKNMTEVILINLKYVIVFQVKNCDHMKITYFFFKKILSWIFRIPFPQGIAISINIKTRWVCGSLELGHTPLPSLPLLVALVLFFAVGTTQFSVIKEIWEG